MFSSIDKEGGSSKLKTQAIRSYDDMNSKFNLFDTFRSKNPYAQEYSWEVLNPKIIRERIDMIFISKSLEDHVCEAGLVPPHKTCSDHGIAYVRIKGNEIPSRGPGTWKFNNSLLNEKQFVLEMSRQIPLWILEAETDIPGNYGSQWGFIKHNSPYYPSVVQPY